MDTLKILIPIVVAHIAALVVIVFVIKKLLFGDTVAAVTRIRQVEAEVRKKEEAIRLEIQEHEKDFAVKKSEAESALQKQREQSEKEVSKLRDQITADARKEADKIMEQARKNEENLRKQIAQDMEEKAVAYGGEVFKMVFSEEVNQEVNKRFIAELLDALEQLDAGAITVDGSQAEFTTSHPMDPEQKARLECLLDSKFGVKMKVEEKVKPELLAGLIFKLGSLEIDGSLLNRYQEAAAEVKKSAMI
jgi:F-type H+-transporting ATPase subunit b